MYASKVDLNFTLETELRNNKRMVWSGNKTKHKTKNFFIARLRIFVVSMIPYVFVLISIFQIYVAVLVGISIKIKTFD